MPTLLTSYSIIRHGHRLAHSVSIVAASLLTVIGLAACSPLSTTPNDSDNRTTMIDSNYQKPGAPVRLTHNTLQANSQGDAITLMYTLEFSATIQSMVTTINSTSGIGIMGEQTLIAKNLATISSMEKQINLMAWQSGFVNIIVVVVDNQGQQSARSFSIPVTVAGNPPTMKPTGELATELAATPATTTDGEN